MFSLLKFDGIRAAALARGASQMTAMPTIDPRVVGLPPERHAGRVVGEMARWPVGERARLTGELVRDISAWAIECVSDLVNLRGNSIPADA
jgi:hypothetical protein